MDVFISHSSEDKPIADAACAALESAGLTCWMAPRNIVPGADWGAAIIEGIEQSRLFVLVFTGHANRSPQVAREVERAAAKGLPIIPFRVEDVRPTKGLEYFISSQHWLDASKPPLELHLARLSETAVVLLKGDPAAPATKAIEADLIAGKGGLTSRRKSNRTLAAITAAICLAIIFGGGAWLIFASLTRVKTTNQSLEQTGAPPVTEVVRSDPIFVQAIQEWFRRWDEDRNGRLSVVEVRRVLSNRNSVPEEFAQTLRRLDVNHDDGLTEEELMSIARYVVEYRDRDGDGRYTVVEFLVTHRNNGGKESAATITKMFGSDDTDRDGFVTVPEVERSIAKMILSNL